MEGFSVSLSGLNQRIAEEESLIGQLKSLETELESIRGRIDFQVKGRAGITGSLKRIDEELQNQISALNGMKNALDSISNLYQTTEKKNSGTDGLLLGAGAAIASAFGVGAVTEGGFGSGIGSAFGTALGGILGGIHSGMGNVFGQVHGGGGIAEGLFGDGIQIDWKDNYKYGLYKEDQRKTGTKTEMEYKDGKWQVVKKEKYDTATDPKEEGNQDKKDDSKKKQKEFLESITIASASNSFSSALWEGKLESDHGSLEADVFKFEANANAFLNAAGAGGEIGLGVTALHAGMKEQIGDDNFGAHVAGDVTIGKASAKAGGKVGFLDENGNAALNLGVNASAEAIALQANASAGVDIFGADVDVKAGVTVGVGAHADIGFYDGKFKFDVGAAMGIGVNVDLEIDLSKPMEYIGNVGKEIGKGISDLADKGKKFLSNIFGW